MDLAWCLVCEKKLQSDKNLYCSTHCQMLDFQWPSQQHQHDCPYLDLLGPKTPLNPSSGKSGLILPKPETSPSLGPSQSTPQNHQPLVFEIHPLDSLSQQHHQHVMNSQKFTTVIATAKRRPFQVTHPSYHRMASSPSSESLSSSSSSSNTSSPTPSLGPSSLLRIPPIKKLLKQSTPPPPSTFEGLAIHSSDLLSSRPKGSLYHQPLLTSSVIPLASSKNERVHPTAMDMAMTVGGVHQGNRAIKTRAVSMPSEEEEGISQQRPPRQKTSANSSLVSNGSSPLAGLASWKRAALKSHAPSYKIPVSFPPHSSYILHLGR